MRYCCCSKLVLFDRPSFLVLPLEAAVTHTLTSVSFCYRLFIYIEEFERFVEVSYVSFTTAVVLNTAGHVQVRGLPPSR